MVSIWELIIIFVTFCVAMIFVLWCHKNSKQIGSMESTMNELDSLYKQSKGE